MSFSSLLYQDVTVIRTAETGAVDDYGTPEVAESTRVTYKGRVMDDGRHGNESGKELTPGRETQIGFPLLVLPGDADITGVDRVEVDGLTYEVDGPPARIQGASSIHHLEIPLRLVERG